MIDVLVLMRILILLAVLISCIYGFRKIQKGNSNDYFLVALYGMLSILFARIYYLVLVLSNGNDSTLTIGVLGQASAYLFFLIANTRYLSCEFTKKIRNVVSYKSFICLVIIGIALFLAAFKMNDLASYIGNTIYFLTMGNALYTSTYVIFNRKKIHECKYVFSFNVCLTILIVLNVLLELTNSFISSNLIMSAFTILTIMSIITISLMLPLLNKGVIKWKQ